MSLRGVGVPADRQAELDCVVAELLPARARESVHAESAPVPFDDREVLDRMFASRRGAAIRALYDGVGRDASAGDLALCNHLAFWFGGDPERIDRVFRASARMRDKWERQDYREATITKALAATAERYRPARGRSRDCARNDSMGLEL